MKLSQVLADRSSVTVPFGEHSLKVTYKPHVYTPKFQSEADRAAQGEDTDRLSAMLSPLLDSWDLTDDDGKMITLDVASLRSLPIKILSDVLLAILRDFNPNPPTSGSTASG
jgi:hypothetical protein